MTPESQSSVPETGNPLPCPFCGEKPFVLTSGPRTMLGNPGDKSVECINSDCPLYGDRFAWDAWNRRHSPSGPTTGDLFHVRMALATGVDVADPDMLVSVPLTGRERRKLLDFIASHDNDDRPSRAMSESPEGVATKCATCGHAESMHGAIRCIAQHSFQSAFSGGISACSCNKFAPSPSTAPTPPAGSSPAAFMLDTMRQEVASRSSEATIIPLAEAERRIQEHESQGRASKADAPTPRICTRCKQIIELDEAFSVTTGAHARPCIAAASPIGESPAPTPSDDVRLAVLKLADEYEEQAQPLTHPDIRPKMLSIAGGLRELVSRSSSSDDAGAIAKLTQEHERHIAAIHHWTDAVIAEAVPAALSELKEKVAKLPIERPEVIERGMRMLGDSHVSLTATLSLISASIAKAQEQKPMSSRLNRPAYERLIRENIEWLDKQPRTLERDHIRMILDQAVEYEYGPIVVDQASVADDAGEVEGLLKEADYWLAHTKNFTFPRDVIERLASTLRSTREQRDDAIRERWAAAKLFQEESERRLEQGRDLTASRAECQRLQRAFASLREQVAAISTDLNGEGVRDLVLAHIDDAISKAQEQKS